MARTSCSYRRLSELLKQPYSLAAVAALLIDTELDLSREQQTQSDAIGRNRT